MAFVFQKHDEMHAIQMQKKVCFHIVHHNLSFLIQIANAQLWLHFSCINATWIMKSGRYFSRRDKFQPFKPKIKIFYLNRTTQSNIQIIHEPMPWTTLRLHSQRKLIKHRRLTETRAAVRLKSTKYHPNTIMLPPAMGHIPLAFSFSLKYTHKISVHASNSCNFI